MEDNLKEAVNRWEQRMEERKRAEEAEEAKVKAQEAESNRQAYLARTGRKRLAP